MELKDKLKKLRKARGLTQTQLADAIFVSRSAVAKWENGLGLPSEASIEALQASFGISLEDIATTEPEKVIVRKNQRLRKISWALGVIALAALTLFSVCLPFLLQSGKYGFTPAMAAGSFSDNPYIDTGDYRFYYSTFEGELEDGRRWTSLSAFRPVRRHFWGCTVRSADYTYSVILRNNRMVGKLYSIYGQNGWYNWIVCSSGAEMDLQLVTLTQIRTSGTAYPVEKGFFFTTPEPVENFWIGQDFYRVE